MARPSNPQPDDWLDQQLRQVEVPQGLVARLQKLAGRDDSELDAMLVEVPLPEGLLQRLRRIASPLPVRRAWGSVVAAAALVLWLSITYTGAIVGLVLGSYQPQPPSGDRLPDLSAGFSDALPEPDLGQLLEATQTTFESLASLPVEVPLPIVKFEETPAAATARLPVADRWSARGLGQSWQPLVQGPNAGSRQQWSDLQQLLGSADLDPRDNAVDLWRLPRQLERGIRPPLEAGFDSLFLLRHKQHPVIVLPRASAVLRSVAVPLVSDTYSFEHCRRLLAQRIRPAASDVRIEEFLAVPEYRFTRPVDSDLGLTVQGGVSPFGGPALPALLQVGVQARDSQPEIRLACRLTVVLDRSASMQQTGRLELARLGLRGLLETLGPADQLSIVTFAEQATVLCEDVDPRHVELVRPALEQLEGGRGTNWIAGLELGYDLALSHDSSDGRRHRVVLVTDGLAALPSPVLHGLQAALGSAAEQGVSLSVLDVGDHQRVDPNLARLCEVGQGKWLPAATADEVRWQLVELLTGRSQLIAQTTRLTVEFAAGAVEAYRLLGHEATDASLRGGVLEFDLRAGQAATALFELRPNPNYRGPMATVRLQWREPFTGLERTQEQVVEASAIAADWARTPLAVQQAAVAAELAEILRGSPFAQGSNWAAVTRVIEQLPYETMSAARFARVLELVRSAAQLTPER